MKRKIIKALYQWKNRKNHKPLILEGARQVGKTYSALEFGREAYENVVYVNFEDNMNIEALFRRDLNPSRIIKELSVTAASSIFPGKTLIVFDEIQSCERALTSLKYFNEQAPEYDIIAAGSLLGVAVNRSNYSFPVGKVDFLKMFPMDFEEFLWAIGQEKMGELICEYYHSLEAFPLHEQAMGFLENYLSVGGMPAVVKTYIESNDQNQVINEQKGINHAYIADMAKYATPQETARLMDIWNSIPAQLAKENKKFQYKMVKSGARAYQYESALAWLASSGLINRCFRISKGRPPLSVFEDTASFKLYSVDSGLLFSRYGVRAEQVFRVETGMSEVRGALAENYMMQALIQNEITPYYWTENRTRSELDFVFQNSEGAVIPIEVKSGINVRAKSLNTFIQTYAPKRALRVSARNFGRTEKIESIPLYAAHCIRNQERKNG